MFKIGKKILACTLLLVLMALLPFTAVKCSNKGNKHENKLTSSTSKTKTETKTEDEKTDKNDEIIIGLTAVLCGENFSKEAIKAIAIPAQISPKAKHHLLTT